MKRNHFIDYLKSFLVILVITGHVIQGKLADEPLRYFIYSFHIPLFLACSGYLIEFQRLKEVKYSSLVKKYFDRMLIAWTIAFITYFLYEDNGRLLDISLRNYVISILYPYYHLWYVPELFLMLSTLYFFIKIEYLFISFIIIILFGYLNINPISFREEHPFWINIMDDKRYFTLFYFFFIGFYIRNFSLDRINKLPKSKIFFITFIAVLLRIITFLKNEPTLELISLVVLNTLLIIIIFHLIASRHKTTKENHLMRFISDNSLFFYLWHVLVFKLLYQLFPQLMLTNYNIGEFIVLFTTIGILFSIAFIFHSVNFLRPLARSFGLNGK